MGLFDKLRKQPNEKNTGSGEKTEVAAEIKLPLFLHSVPPAPTIAAAVNTPVANSAELARSEALQWENVYVFISSTFNDMHAERDYLVKRVFPELSEWCERRKLRLVDIDLRWGVTEADSEKNKRVVEVCLKNIDKCRPFFLCFLGQRRGWVPAKEDISAGTFRSYEKLARYLGASVTEMEIIHAFIDPLLKGSIEELQKQEQVFFFLRDPNYLEDITNQAIRNIYTNQGAANPAEADQALAYFKDQVVGKSGRPIYYYTGHWDDKSTTPELALAGTATDADGQSIIRGRLTDFSCGGETLASKILAALKQAIEQRYPGRNVSEQNFTPLQRELDQQEQFLQLAGEGFIPRAGDFDQIISYIHSDERRSFALCAAAGLGKTSFLAYFIEKILPKENILTVYRFVGVSDDSCSLHRLLASILEQLKAVGRIQAAIPVTAKEIKGKFFELLGNVGDNGKVVIIIDALNQLESGLCDLTWLSWLLPPNVKLIFSFKLGEEKGDELAQSLMKENKSVLEQVRPFETADDRASLITQYLSHYLKELDEDNIETIISSQGAANPLFLKILLSELRVFGSHLSLRQIIRNRFGHTPLSAFDAVLERIENDPAYSAIDTVVLVAHVFGWLTHAKNGLSAEELTELLVKAQISDSRQAAYDAVQLLLRQLRPYLARREGRIDFFYESFFLAARNRYSRTHALAKADADWHRDLAEFFEQLAPDSPRYLAEIAYQYAHAGMAGELCSILLDYRFIEQRLMQADIAAVIEDFSYAQLAEAKLDKEAKTAMSLIGDALALASAILVKNPAQLPTQLFGRLLGFDIPQIRYLLDDTVRYLQQEKRPWLRPLSPCMPAPGGALMRTYTPSANGIFAFKDRQRMLVSSKTDSSVKLVEIKTGKVLRSYQLEAIPGAKYMNDFLLVEEANVFAIRISGALLLMDIDTEQIHKVPGFTGLPRRGLYGKGNLLISHDKTLAEKDFRLNVVDVDAGEIIHTFTESVQNTSMGFVFNDDLSLLFIGTDDNKVAVFDVKNDFALLYQIGIHPKYVTDICLLEEADVLITKAADNHLYIWRMADQKLLLDVCAGFGEAFLASHDGRTLVIGNFGRLDFYSLESFAKMRSIEAGGDKVISLLFSDDDSKLFVGRNSGVVECLDIMTDTVLAAYREHSNYVGQLVLSADQTCLVSGGLAAGICVWDLQAVSDIQQDEGVRALHLVSADLAADDTFLLCIDEKGRVQRVETSNMAISDICTVSGVSVPEIRISADGRHFGVRTKLDEMKIFATANGEIIGSFQALDPYGDKGMAQLWQPTFLAAEACLSSRNVTVVSHQGGKIIVQDIDKPESPQIIDAFAGRISWFKVFDGGRKLVVFSTGNEACPLTKLNQKQGFESAAKIYDTVTWECILHTKDHLAAYFAAIGVEEFEDIQKYLRTAYGNSDMKNFRPIVDCLYRDNAHMVYLRKKLYDNGMRFPFWDTDIDREVTNFEVEGNAHEHLFSKNGRNLFFYGYGKTLYPLYFENPQF